MLKAKRIRLLPTSKQHKYMMEIAHACRKVWNWALHFQFNYIIRNGKFISDKRLYEIFTKYKNTKYGNWMNKYPIQTLRWVIHDLGIRLERFYKLQKEYKFCKFTKKWLKYCKKKNINQTYALYGFPKFKSHNNFKIAYCNGDMTYFKYDKKNGKVLGVFLQKLDCIKLKTNYNLPKGSKKDQIKIIKNGRVTYNHGKWMLSFVEEVSVKNDITLKKYTLGIDVGIRRTATIAYGNQIIFFKNITNSFLYRKLENNLKHHQRNLRRKIKNSKRYNRELKYIRKLYYKLSNMRRNWIHYITSIIINLKPKSICLENLNVEGMKSNHYLAPLIQNAMFKMIFNQLIYKCKECNIEIKIANMWYPSSKICHNCGHKNKNLNSELKWKCPNCGIEHDRDVNAALNLRDYNENWKDKFLD